ncbi:hypothetical protein ACWZJV_04685 [Nocardioides sp. WG-D5]|uniref:hypothetical protein n=1 Tax=Nocardioides luteus TaxID=1844 RepID=UPI0002029212|nr:hypothetical protein [Nocardioides luteus]EGD43786.1 hypothetical protein NBCG_01913 [Nocardioidaceae bacterium Broad-1]MBG6095613.1 hypothetical protein [Nocardioides luteus]
MSRQMTITIHDPDVERLEELSSVLRRELLDLGVDDVERASAGEAPAGTRGIDIAAIGVLIVAFQEPLVAVTAIVGAIRGWMSSARGAHAVELTIGDQTLKIDSASREQQDRLIDEFVAALHASGEPDPPASSPVP